jgi:hypothetical protein
MMSLVPIVAALLSTAPAEGLAAAYPAVDRSISDSDRLKELEIDVRSAQAKGRIDRATAARFHVGIARVRRQMFRMGMQFGYRQKVRLRQRIDRLYARLAAYQGANIR